MKACTIMIIDDNADDVFFAERAIVRTCSGCSIDVFSGGDEAIKHLESGKNPDLIFLDLNMPGLDGTAVLRFIRASSKARYIPVVMLSQSVLEEDLRAAFDAGANSFIHKAHDMSEFADRMKTSIHYWIGVNMTPS